MTLHCVNLYARLLPIWNPNKFDYFIVNCLSSGMQTAQKWIEQRSSHKGYTCRIFRSLIRLYLVSSIFFFLFLVEAWIKMSSHYSAADCPVIGSEICFPRRVCQRPPRVAFAAASRSSDRDSNSKPFTLSYLPLIIPAPVC